MTMFSNFLFNFINFCVMVSFLTKLLTSGILFLTAVNAEVVAKHLMLVILFSKSLVVEYNLSFEPDH